jgi:hypothetical protein
MAETFPRRVPDDFRAPFSGPKPGHDRILRACAPSVPGPAWPASASWRMSPPQHNGTLTEYPTHLLGANVIRQAARSSGSCGHSHGESPRGGE